MAKPHVDPVRIVHSSPGRTRLRLAGLRNARERAVALADDLAALPGMAEVAVRPWTESVLCLHDSARLEAERIAEVARRHAESPGERPVIGSMTARSAGERQASSIAESVAELVKQIDNSLLTTTEGRLDLGTLATFGFLAAGAVEVLASRRLPAPPWFNLAWWALRTFTEFERPSVPAPASLPRLVPIVGGKAEARRRSGGGNRGSVRRGRQA
jgi:hypothetical protein